MKGKKVLIVGAGPGGLTAGMILASYGYDVNIFEKNSYVGGRTGFIKQDGYTFDIGPTFLMMDFQLKEMFSLAGKAVEDYMTLKRVDPMYRLQYKDNKVLKLYNDQKLMEAQMESLFPGSYPWYLNFLKNEEIKFAKVFPSLKVSYSNLTDMLRKELRAAIPYLDAHKNLFSHLGNYFANDDFKIAFTFQAKYLGMSPWECPGTFSIISFIEHRLGIFHVLGGLNEICQGIAKACRDLAGKITLNTAVKEIIVKNGRAVGLELENGEVLEGDHVIINADFAYAMDNLVPEANKKKYTSEKMRKKKYSCSIFMMYLGVDKQYPLEHHNIYFSDDYKQNITEITHGNKVPEDPSFYIQNAVVTDSSVAPPGKAALYVLVPVSNNFSGIDWTVNEEPFREKILTLLEQKAGLTDIRSHIETEKIITPKTWEEEYNVYSGATFNLAHNIGQMLYFRPHNKFEEFDNCYLVGGGTHPGSGLPTILESARISSSLILEKDNVSLTHFNDHSTLDVMGKPL